MTTSIFSAEANALTPQSAETPALKIAGSPELRLPHSLASRFVFLNLCLAIVLTALAFGTVHYWALALFALGAALTIVLWVADAWKLERFRLSANPLQLALLGMLALGLVQLLPLRNPEATDALTIPAVKTLSLDPYSTRFVIVQVAALLIYFAATLVFTDTPHRLRLLVRTIIIFGFFMAMLGLTQTLTSPTKVYWFRELTQSTPFGPFINRHHFAGYMELTIGLPLGLLFSGAVERYKRFIYFFAASLMAVALIMTNSRGGVISLGAELFFLAVVAGVGRRRRKREAQDKAQRVRKNAVRAALALAMIVAVFAGVVWLGGDSGLNRLVGSVNMADPTTGRAHFWSVTTDIIKAHPLIGTGLGAFGVVYTHYDTRNGLFRLEQAHNDYLQILSDGGLVGAALGLFFVVMLFRMGFTRRESNDDFRNGVALGALAGCFAVLVHSFFDFTLHTTSNALLFLILAALATMNGRVEQASSRRRRRRRHTQSDPVAVASANGTATNELARERISS
jgi:O-antigen ligase